MNYKKIFCVNHVGKNLLIVGFNEEIKWQFRAVTQEGEIVQEKGLFETAQEAEKVGYEWIIQNLPV